MGPPLKGKKAWRKNIDSSEMEKFLTDAAHQERRGPAVESLPDAALFFEDKAADTEGAQQLALGKGRSMPRSKQLQLRSSAIINQAHQAQPVGVHKPPRKVNAVSKKPARRPRFASVPEKELDIWAEGVVIPGAPAAPNPGYGSGPVRRKVKAKALPSKVAAVDIDHAGCSYNPDEEAHQEALAALVASEMKKALYKELAPKAPPQMVAINPEEEGLDEITRLQVEAPADANEIDLSDEDDQGGGAAAARAKAQKKSRKDRNKDKRREEQEKEAEQRRQLKRQRRDLEQLKSLQQQIEEETQLKEIKRLRRQVVKEEKASTLPGRLGRHKFEAPSVQVATSDELAGSLRRIKPCAMVALHRYKSLQQRGLIEPRKPVVAKQGKRIEYEKGARLEKALEGQAEIAELQKARKELSKSVKRGKKAAAKAAAAGLGGEDLW